MLKCAYLLLIAHEICLVLDILVASNYFRSFCSLKYDSLNGFHEESFLNELIVLRSFGKF